MGEVQVVCQREGQILIQLAVQFDLGLLGNVGTDDQQFLGQLREDPDILGVHIVKGALNGGKVGQFVRNRGKPDALADHHHFPPGGIQRESCTGVDFLDDFHSRCLAFVQFPIKKPQDSYT